MLLDINIQNYRCFKEFNLDGLARVNLLVGMNNSGKTSLLEAVDLLVNQEEPERLFDLLLNRREVERGSEQSLRRATISRAHFQIGHLFYGHQLNPDRAICLRSQKQRPLSLQIQIAPVLEAGQLSLNEDTFDPEITNFELVFLYGEDRRFAIPVNDDGLIPSGTFLRMPRKQSRENYFRKNQHLSRFLTSRRQDFERVAANLWKQITLTPEEETVIKALQILEPDVEGINFPSSEALNQQGLVKLRGQRYPIPLGSMGDGMTHIVNLIASVVTLEKGVLLVDEIDAGLHYNVQAAMWKLLLETAQRLDLQIFATTHSYDCVTAFSEALKQLEADEIGKLFRLDWRGDMVRAVDYSAEILSAAVRQNIEVR